MRLLPFIKILPFLIPVAQFCTAQSTEVAPAYEWFDQVVGRVNTGIYNGIEYSEQHRTINEHHKFFLSDNFISGKVVYNGQPYYDLKLKFNVFDQLLLVNLVDEGNETFFQLISEKIDKFSIADREFINIRGRGEPDGFYELLLERDNLSLLKKHSKYQRKVSDKKFVYHEFKDENNDHLLLYEGNFYEINSRRDLFEIFPEARDIIREHYSSKKAQLKSQPDAFMKDLLQLLSNHLKV